MKPKIMKLVPIPDGVLANTEIPKSNQRNPPPEPPARRSNHLCKPHWTAGTKTLAERCHGVRLAGPHTNTILFITEDAGLHQQLRGLANEQGRMVVRVTGAVSTARMLQLLKPAAVVLDLDLSRETAWTVGATLLLEQDCPPLMLLTARREPFDLRTAIRSGSVLEKSGGPWRLLDTLDHALAENRLAQIKRNAALRALLHWLRPRGWSRSMPVAHRFWGINE
jgi:CheY-like chemotaxis protein